MADNNEPTVFIVDDDAAVLDSLSFLMRSVGLRAETFSSARSFLDTYDPERPGCLVLDVRMPEMSGLELQQKLLAMGSTLPILFLTAHGDVPMAVQAVKAGALDFIQKPFRDQELIDRINQAIEEDERIRGELADAERIRARVATLTPREREVMDLVASGAHNKVIARELGISQRTVEAHRARVMEKMGCRSVAELVRMALHAAETE